MALEATLNDDRVDTILDLVLIGPDRPRVGRDCSVVVVMNEWATPGKIDRGVSAARAGDLGGRIAPGGVEDHRHHDTEPDAGDPDAISWLLVDVVGASFLRLPVTSGGRRLPEPDRGLRRPKIVDVPAA